MAAYGSLRDALTPEVRLQRLRPAMGTWVAIAASAPTEQAAAAGIEGGYLAVSEIAERMHPHREGSDLARINSAPTQTPVSIHGTTWELLRLAQWVHVLSEGVFDPCLPCCPGRLSDLTLSEGSAGSRWALCRVPLTLDLGGIAKGYAIDRAIDALHATGCASGLVNAGGDLRAYGRAENALLRHADGTCVPVTLKDAALAVSDLDADVGRRPAEHQGYYRRSGGTRRVRRYAAVIAASAAVADAVTKCVLLAERRSTTRTLRALGARQIG